MQHAQVSSKAQIGINVQIGYCARIYENAVIGDNSVIDDFACVGYPASGKERGIPVVIGDGAIVRSHSVLYEGSTYGPQLRVGHHSMLREGIRAGKNFQVGSFNDLEGDAAIGDWVRFHSNVHIGRGSVIGDLVWIFPYVVLTNDPIPPSGLKEGATVGDAAVICTSAVVLPGTEIGIGAFVAAMSRARGVVPAGALVVGFEGKVVGSIKKLRHRRSGKQHPWMTHFSEYYPQEAQTRIQEIYQALLPQLEAFDD
jgi:UDP-3-O-[3-hydroxymyristoyl] glucosamine N-acyltransferase